MKTEQSIHHSKMVISFFYSSLKLWFFHGVLQSKVFYSEAAVQGFFFIPKTIIFVKLLNLYVS